MLRICSDKKAARILDRYAGWLAEIQEAYGIPRAAVQAVLYQEMTGMDVFDWAADGAVALYWLRFRLRRKLRRMGLPLRETPRFQWGPFGKKDSSTGYAQVFAYVGINAVAFARARSLLPPDGLGLPNRPLRPDSEEDLCLVWNRLHRDRRFNMEIAALNLISAAEEMTGRIDFPGYSPGEWQLIFTRYNANARHVTPYGQAAYRRFLHYSGQDAPPAPDPSVSA